MIAQLRLPGAVAIVFALSRSSAAQHQECQLGKLAVDPTYREQWGQSVAVAADRALIGVSGEIDFGTWGAAYLFHGIGRWEVETILTCHDNALPNGFGDAAVLRSDGNLAFVGAPYDGIPDFIDGSVYVFEQTRTGAWVQTAKISAQQPDGNSGENDYFGAAIALDGDRVLVGAYNDTSAYIFDRNSDGLWAQSARFTPSQGGWYFGYSVALHGSVAVVGAPNDSTQGGYAGAAFVFERAADGSWSQVARLLPEAGALQRFGWSSSVNGTTAMICSPAAFDGHGAVYVFERGPSGEWSRRALLRSGNPELGYSFGSSVTLEGDLAIIGAAGADDGAAFVVGRAPDGEWSQIARLAAPYGGTAVALHGNVAVVGAPALDEPEMDAGAAYVFAVGPDSDSDGVMDVCQCRAAGDLDFTGVIDLSDLIILLSSFGLDAGGDLDGNGETGIQDLAHLLANWSLPCP